MSLSSQEQFRKFLEQSKNILVLCPENPSADCIGSAYAIHFFLKKKGISSSVAFSGGVEKKFSFLPSPEKSDLLNEISGAREFVLSFDTQRNKIKNIRHEKIEGKFNIYVTPEKGSIDPRDFSFILAKFKYDLLICVGASDLEKLGNLYFENPDLFFEVPIANLDHRSENDSFGQVNLVDVMASSCSEVTADFMEKIFPRDLDEKIATCLLFGIIVATDRFQKKNTSPRTLLAASRLMEKGADQQEIIRHLYKTHQLHILKLWGRAMAKINFSPELSFVWSILSIEDFVQSRASENDTAVILEKLEESYSQGKIFAIAYSEKPGLSTIRISAGNPEAVKNLQSILGGDIRQDFLEIKKQNSPEEAIKEISEKIRHKIS